MFVLQNRSSLKCPNIHRKISVLGSLFNEVAGLQTWNFIKRWLKYRCFPVNVVNFLRTAFSIEHHWWLLLLRSKGKNFKWKKKIKTFHLNYTCNYVNIRTDCPFSLTFSSNFLFFDSILCFYFLQTEKYIFLHLLVFSEAGIESCSVKQLFGKIEPKLSIFFYKTGVSFQYSLLNKKVYKYIKSEILCRYSSRVMVVKSILHCNWTTIFLSQLWMAASDHLFN